MNGGLALITGATGELGPHVVAAFVTRGDRVIALPRFKSSICARASGAAFRTVPATKPPTRLTTH